MRKRDFSVGGEWSDFAEEGTSHLRFEGKASEANSQRKGVPGRENSICKGPRRKGRVDERNSEEARVLGAERARDGRSRRGAKSQGAERSGILSQAQ